MGKYESFDDVYRGTISGVFANESELRQAFVEALKNELARSSCNKYIVGMWLSPALDRIIDGRKKPDIRLSNIVIEVERPNAGLGKGLEQLKQYMEALYRNTSGRIEILGLVTDGREAILLKYDGKYATPQQGVMPEVARKLIELFCSSKIPVINAKDLVDLFGV